MKIALLGQPNTGKSTLFNRVAGVKARTSNLPGTTVRVHESPVRVNGEVITIVDLPGTYSLTPLDPAQAEVLNYLIRGDVSVLIVVLDATALARGLELVAEATELGLPMVMCLNLCDQLHGKGMEIDVDALSEAMDTRVIPCSALHGKGIARLLREAISAARDGIVPRAIQYSRDVEGAIKTAMTETGGRFRAIKAIEGVEGKWGLSAETARKITSKLEGARGLPSWEIIAAERHHFAMKTAESVTSRLREGPSVSSRVDRILMHPWWGSLLAIAIFGFFFWVIFYLGRWLEGLAVHPLESLFSSWTAPLVGTLPGAVFGGFLEGILGGVGIVLPFFVPLIFLTAILEDLGYLPRVAHLIDGLMHRIGLHGKAVIPFIVGYGCSVPAMAAVRIMESRRDRVLTGVLAPMIPCGARTVIILGLVGYFLGGWWALAIYGLNILVIALVGAILSRLRRGESWGMVMEIPPYRLPTFRSIWFNVWLQLREFLVIAFPVLLLGSCLLGLLDYWNVSGLVDTALSPFTAGLLGLPRELGAPLVFGFFRKELALVMAAQALSASPTTMNLVLTSTQMMTYTVFAVFYVPCLATVAVSWRELGWKVALGSAGLSTGVATIVALLVRGLSALFMGIT